LGYPANEKKNFLPSWRSLRHERSGRFKHLLFGLRAWPALDSLEVWPDATPYGGVHAYRCYDGTGGAWIENWGHVDTNEQLVTWTDNPGGLNFQPFEMLMLRFTDTNSGQSDQESEEKVLVFLQTTPFAPRIHRYGSQNSIVILIR
jgi:hypothetical protein